MPVAFVVCANRKRANLGNDNVDAVNTGIGICKYPGGIVYSDGTSAIYCDFATGKETNLTGDLKGAVVKWPFAVSQNGEWIVWKQGPKFWVRAFPKGTPYAIQYREEDKKKNICFSWQSSVTRMLLSPEGTRFSFEGPNQGPSWNLVRQGNPPFYGLRMGTYNGIFMLSTIQNVYREQAFSLGIYHPKFGNEAQYPNTNGGPYNCSDQDDKAWKKWYGFAQVGNGTRIGPIPSAGWRESIGGGIYANKNVKKSAYFLTFADHEMWAKGKKFVYYIYHTDDGKWGPIEIRLVSSEINTPEGDNYEFWTTESWEFTEARNVVKAWEIPVSLSSCEGLAAKPDGSLTVLSGGNLYLIDHYEIEKGMSASKVVGVFSSTHKCKFVDYDNNVFRVQASLIAKGLIAGCLQWVSNDSFIFLAEDNSVYSWKQVQRKTARAN